MGVHIDGLNAASAHDLPAPPTGAALACALHCAARKYDTGVCTGCIIRSISLRMCIFLPLVRCGDGYYDGMRYFYLIADSAIMAYRKKEFYWVASDHWTVIDLIRARSVIF
jgi:hypothetical protein